MFHITLRLTRLKYIVENTLSNFSLRRFVLFINYGHPWLLQCFFITICALLDNSHYETWSRESENAPVTNVKGIVYITDINRN